MMRHFHTRFDQKNLTGNAGLVHLGRFAQKLGMSDYNTPKFLSHNFEATIIKKWYTEIKGEDVWHSEKSMMQLKRQEWR